MKFAFRCLLGHDWLPWTTRKAQGGWEKRFRSCKRCGAHERQWTPPARFFR